MRLENPKYQKNRKGYSKDQLVYLEQIEQHRLINKMVNISVYIESSNDYVRESAIKSFEDSRIICSKKIFTPYYFKKYQRYTNKIAAKIKKMNEDKLFNGIAKEFEKHGRKLK